MLSMGEESREKTEVVNVIADTMANKAREEKHNTCNMNQGFFSDFFHPLARSLTHDQIDRCGIVSTSRLFRQQNVFIYGSTPRQTD
jgi:hypothetical protein